MELTGPAVRRAVYLFKGRRNKEKREKQRALEVIHLLTPCPNAHTTRTGPD